MASASSSSSVSDSQSIYGWSYDVFLSFRGTDTRTTFLDFLYTLLKLKTIRTFKDDDRIEKGADIPLALVEAIEQSRFFIAVFSKDYASSKWCLEELATIMERQEKFKDQIVVPIFYHVNPSDVKHQTGSFEASFKEHEKNVELVTEGKVQRWREALKKAGGLKGHHLKNEYNGHEGECAEGVVANILDRLNQSTQPSPDLVGLESRVNHIGDWLRLVSDDAAARFIGICGMGGIGKTTIADAVYIRFRFQFDGACFLHAVRHRDIVELQKTLLTEILNEKSAVKIDTVQEGIDKIKSRFKGKKVLIVLDDVDHVEQLQGLAGCQDWFGEGSRVIITTRSRGVLRAHRVDKKYIYKVEKLGEQEAIQVFCWHAFEQKIPKKGFEGLCGSIVHYAMGLPLILKVLGCHLSELDAVYWRDTLKELKDTDIIHTPKDKILNVLRISYDGLDPYNKNVFLHIACFLRNYKQEVVKDVLESNLLVLIEKSLISVQNGEIEMHDRIQEMGYHIASEENPRNPRKIVWQLKDANDAKDLLSRNMEYIEGIGHSDLSSPPENNTYEITLRGMRNLKILKVGSNIVFRISEKYLPSSLSWIEFQPYHFNSLPDSFASSKLVGLSLKNSSLENCRITQKLHKLTHLDLSYSESLLETPDFDLMPNLTTLMLVGCLNLKVVHSSIGNLRKLVSLDLSGCNNLEELPCFNQVSCLKDLDLESCSKLNNFPEIRERMPHLVELELREVGIIELHSSIQQLQGLTKLYLDDCEHLVCLSTGFCELKNLKVVVINHCTNLKSLPENLQGLVSLEYLNLYGSNFVSLPESFNQLPCLQYLDIRACRKLKVLPKLPKTTCELYADSCFSSRIDELADFPELQSVAFSSDDGGERSVYNFAKMCIHFPSHRKTPLSITDPTYSEDECSIYEVEVLRIFQYRCYKSNGIAIDLNPGWYCTQFVGFAVYFLTGLNTFGFHSYKDIVDVQHFRIIVKLSCKDNRNEVLERKCAIVISSNGYSGPNGSICFAYIPFSGLWPAESNSVTPNDFSRFEVNFMDSEATANWGCSLLYERSKTPARWDDSCKGSTTDIGPLGMLEYLNLSGKEFDHLPEDISLLCPLKYLDISGCIGLKGELPKLPPTIKELYASSYLASESNIVELATKYSKLHSVSFSQPIDEHPAPTLVPGELAKKFIPITRPFLNRNTPFAVTYLLDSYTDYKISRCFKYPHHDPHHDPHKISVSLDPSWYRHNFVGFVVCFVFPWQVRWESRPDKCPFSSCRLITKLTHKDNGSEPLQTECVIGRLYDEEFDWRCVIGRLYDEEFDGRFDDEEGIVCFVYIPFSSLWPKSKAITDNTSPNHYLVFEATIQDLEFSSGWSYDLLYTDDKSLTEAIRQKRESFGSSEGDSEEEEEEEEEEDEDEDGDGDGDGEEEGEEDEDEDEDGDGDGEGEGEGEGDGEGEEEEDGGSEHTENSGGDDAMAEDSSNSEGVEDKEEEDEEDGGSEHKDSGGGDEMAEDSNPAAEKKTSKRPAAMSIDELEARLKEKDPTATSNAKKMRLHKGGIVIRSPKSSTIDLLSADFMVSKALEKAAAAAAASSEKMDVLPAAPLRESQKNIIVDSDEAVGLENILASIFSTELGAEAALAGPSQQLPQPIPSTVLAINPDNLNLQTERPSKERVLHNNGPFRLTAGLEENSNLSVFDSCVEEDADEFFIIKSLRSACAITEKLLDKKRHLKNELSEERSRVTELEEKNIQLETRNKELVVQLQDQQPTIDQLEKEKHELTMLVQTYEDWATQAEAARSDLLQRYGTLEKQQLEGKEQYKKLEKEQLEVKDQCEGLKRSCNDAMLENEILKKKLLEAEESGVSNWQQSPNFLNEVITRAMGQPEQRRKFFQVLEANPTGKEKLLDDNTNACLHGMRKMQQAIYNQLREIAPDDFDVQKWGLPKELPDTESQNGAAGSSMQGPAGS